MASAMSKGKHAEHVEVRDLKVTNTLGIHARPASKFVKLASKYQSEIMVRMDNVEVNGKSIMGLLMLAAGCGSNLHLQAKGDDAKKALDDLSDLVKRDFDE